MRTKLKAEGANQRAVLAYIESNASDSLVQRINDGVKTLAGCWQFIVSEAKKRAVKGCACIEDKEVFGWAIHYFEEDAIEEGKAEAVAVETGKTEASPAALQKQDKPKKAKALHEDQMSLLDMFG